MSAVGPGHCHGPRLLGTWDFTHPNRLPSEKPTFPERWYCCWCNRTRSSGGIEGWSCLGICALRLTAKETWGLQDSATGNIWLYKCYYCRSMARLVAF
jgi:hypothetical protein